MVRWVGCGRRGVVAKISRALAGQLIARTVEAHGDLPDIGWRKLEPSNGLRLWHERVIVDCPGWRVLEFKCAERAR